MGTFVLILITVIAVLGMVIAAGIVELRRQREHVTILQRAIQQARLELSDAARLSKIQKEALDEATRKKAALAAGSDADRFNASLDVLSDLSRRRAKPGT